MGIHLQLVDTDQVFDSLEDEPTIINNFNTSIPEDKAGLDQALLTHYSQDTIDEGASCTCGCFTGMYNEGLVCNICNTPVESTIDRQISSMLWMQAPAGILGMIDPEVWMLFSEQLTSRGFNAFEWLANTTYSMESNKLPSEEIKRNIVKLEKRFGNRRGLNNLIRHFDEMLDFILNETNIVERRNRADLRLFIAENRALFFPKHVPIPSKICFIVENTNSGRYIDGLLGPAISAVRTVSSIRSSPVPLKTSVAQNRLVKAIKELSAFYMGYNKRNVFKKPGVYRRHVFGGRTDFTGRAVITSLSDPHHYWELHIPWGLGVQMFKYHIINKLLKRQYAPGRYYTPNKALAFVYSNVLRYNKELDLILQEIIAESPEAGIPAILNRNRQISLICLVWCLAYQTDVVSFRRNADDKYFPNCWDLLRADPPQASRKSKAVTLTV